MVPDTEFLNVCEDSLAVNESDLKCCRHSDRLAKQCPDSNNRLVDNDEESREDEVEKIVKSFFERPDPDEVMLDLETVYSVMIEDFETFTHTPPSSFNVAAILTNMKVEHPSTAHTTQKSGITDEIMCALAYKIVIVESVANIQGDQVVITSKQWTGDTRQLNMLITRSSHFLSYLKLLFNAEHLEVIHMAIGAELLFKVYQEFVKHLVDKITTHERAATIQPKCVKEKGLSKIRGLTHINDDAYEVFIELEEFRVKNMNDNTLRFHGELIVDKCIRMAMKDTILTRSWMSCFADNENKEFIKELLHSIICKYMKAGAGQYIRDFRLAHRSSFENTTEGITEYIHKVSDVRNPTSGNNYYLKSKFNKCAVFEQTL
ncbi:hypothetical protein AC249_AIPGENE11088 [Exaiptasia diaphana]|nr:hypothetical protein AC249_AIPGENE11088 [Exaiptasia diaphana]